MTLTIVCPPRPDPPGPVTLRICGDLDLTTRDRLTEIAAQSIQRSKAVVLDASGISFIDCSGISALIEIAQAADREGAKLWVTPRSRCVDHVLELLDLHVPWAC